MLLVMTNIGTKCGRLKGSKCSDVVLCHPSEMLFYFMSVFLQVNSLNDDLNTPLHIACQHNIKPPIILKLVQVRSRPVFFWYNFWIEILNLGVKTFIWWSLLKRMWAFLFHAEYDHHYVCKQVSAAQTKIAVLRRIGVYTLHWWGLFRSVLVSVSICRVVTIVITQEEMLKEGAGGGTGRDG